MVKRTGCTRTSGNEGHEAARMNGDLDLVEDGCLRCALERAELDGDHGKDGDAAAAGRARLHHVVAVAERRKERHSRRIGAEHAEALDDEVIRDMEHTGLV